MNLGKGKVGAVVAPETIYKVNVEVIEWNLGLATTGQLILSGEIRVYLLVPTILKRRESLKLGMQVPFVFVLQVYKIFTHKFSHKPSRIDHSTYIHVVSAS